MQDFHNDKMNQSNKNAELSKYTDSELIIFGRNLKRAKAYLKKQEKIHGFTFDIYILKLFLEYWVIKRYLLIDVVKYVKKFEKKGFSLLLEANVEFCYWITNRSNERQAIANYLYENGIDTSDSKVYEINGGQFDTIMPDTTNMITKYGKNFNVHDSYIQEVGGKLYRFFKNFSDDNSCYMEEIPEDSTFIYHFSSLDTDSIDIVSELAGTNNTLVTITPNNHPFVNFKFFDKDYQKNAKLEWSYEDGYYEEADDLEIEEWFSNILTESMDGLNYNINTINLKDFQKNYILPTQGVLKGSQKNYRLPNEGDLFGNRSK